MSKNHPNNIKWHKCNMEITILFLLVMTAQESLVSIYPVFSYACNCTFKHTRVHVVFLLGCLCPNLVFL